MINICNPQKEVLGKQYPITANNHNLRTDKGPLENMGFFVANGFYT
jgi:hypothetical protein